ncbi:MarR family winged helix-turn-helix transcriptional regulator [Corynebacterium pacaense]|uniref:MarR family winged helix-turn-helix transcriptional regulator n=1 Tax=Corynebacterium pacaense TaxID=1816684 RepID=UPI0009B9BFBB|nr:MarR family transcriptional regulator [Corynebacterium pacaense]
MAQDARVVDGRTGMAQRWCALQVLHDRIDTHIERSLQPLHGLSVREYSLLEVLSRQHNGIGGHLQMKEVAHAVGLSQSATTRLVSRLEGRGLLSRFICATDRRGIYTEITGEGSALLDLARPTSEAALHEVLDALEGDPELRAFVRVLREEVG